MSESHPPGEAENRSPERRRHPRARVKIPVNIRSAQAGEGCFSTNISLSGICCLMAEPIPLFTRVSVGLQVPLGKSENAGARVLECEGIIVRQEEVETPEGDLFETAIFLQNPPERIGEFLTSHATPQES